MAQIILGTSAIVVWKSSPNFQGIKTLPLELCWFKPRIKWKSSPNFQGIKTIDPPSVSWEMKPAGENLPRIFRGLRRWKRIAESIENQASENLPRIFRGLRLRTAQQHPSLFSLSWKSSPNFQGIKTWAVLQFDWIRWMWKSSPNFQGIKTLQAFYLHSQFCVSQVKIFPEFSGD